ncbi:MAG: aminotransferase class I/II-fold pyridoxal phosphate-dependent enzyme [Acidobacteria bacterium]|nr:aminotransferase class I/II-fold pyridoxal phosphate-dependent enzyme [Acidobacteriota bacterium]
MLTRRKFVGVLAAGLSEAVLAQRAWPTATPPGVVWLNVNEYPEGPPQASIAAMMKVLSESNRYHYGEFASFSAALAASVNLEAGNILVGSGSSEVLHCAVEAFVGPTRPFITGWPSYEAGPELTAAKGYPVVKIPLTSDHASDVKRLAGEATRTGGGLIYVCNPNNPTSSITRAEEIRWLAENLPPETYLLVDEAYIHFTEPPEAERAAGLVRSGKRVMVLRTFSKLYGMAGLRVGFVAAPADLILRMKPFRNNVISIVGVRAALAALEMGPDLIRERRAMIARTRADLTQWCRMKKLKYIEPHANFMMIDTGRNVRELGTALVGKGVVPGRPFPPYDTMLRITIGAGGEMAKFKTALGELLSI